METNNTLKIFLVDDEPYCLHLYAQYLNNLGYTHIQYFSKSADCLDQLTLEPDLVFLDYNMDDLNGIELLKKIKHFDPNIIVVFISGQAEINVAVNALKYGAFDYIIKEKIDEDKIRGCLEKVTQIRAILLKRKQMNTVQKLLGGLSVFSLYYFFQRTLSKI